MFQDVHSPSRNTSGLCFKDQLSIVLWATGTRVFLLTTRVALSFSHDGVALQHEGLEEYIYRFFKHCLRRSIFKAVGEKFVTRTTLRLPSLTVFFHCMCYLVKMEYGWSLLLTDYPATWQKVTSKSKTFRCFYRFFFRPATFNMLHAI